MVTRGKVLGCMVVDLFMFVMVVAIVMRIVLIIDSSLRLGEYVREERICIWVGKDGANLPCYHTYETRAFFCCIAPVLLLHVVETTRLTALGKLSI